MVFRAWAYYILHSHSICVFVSEFRIFFPKFSIQIFNQNFLHNSSISYIWFLYFPTFQVFPKKPKANPNNISKETMPPSLGFPGPLTTLAENALQAMNDFATGTASSSTSIPICSSTTTSTSLKNNSSGKILTSFHILEPYEAKYRIKMGKADSNILPEKLGRVWIFNLLRSHISNSGIMDPRSGHDNPLSLSGSPNGPPEEFANSAAEWVDGSKGRLLNSINAMEEATRKAQIATHAAENATLTAMNVLKIFQDDPDCSCGKMPEGVEAKQHPYGYVDYTTPIAPRLVLEKL